MPTIQPAANAGAVRCERAESSISTVAMIGMGLIATPSAAGSRSPSAAEIPDIGTPFLRSCTSRAGGGDRRLTCPG